MLGILRHRSDNPPITGLILQIGAGTIRNYGQIVAGESNYSKAGIIFTAAELGAAKTINMIAFYFRSYTTPYVMTNQVIKMALVDQSVFAASQDMSFSNLTLTNLTTVKNSFTNNIYTNNLWLPFVLDTPFVYDGIKNLLIIWENNDGSASVGHGGTDGYSVPNSTVIKSGSTGPITGIGTLASIRPNIKIGY